VDEGVVEGSKDVTDTESVLGLLASSGNGGSVVSDLLFFTFFALSALGRLLLAFCCL
jgi:hypothetical protein